jgi:hypothetical protein
MAHLVDDGLMKKLPEPVPHDSEELLELIDQSLAWAATGQVGSEKFEHGMRLYEQAYAHYELVMAREMARAHHDLKNATKALNVSTVMLALVTLGLAVVAVWKAVAH